ncbi:MAG: hypothetical protein MUF87_18110 [Anaerolineae bacterium]|jgi:hypothetical protein|nr:hypothetical protein [Anaerolineae bacterium]
METAFDNDDRAAMRAYLQRCEVRLSTMHRIATAFISGAGLLLLIPVFFRDVIDGILAVYLKNVANLFPSLGDVGGIVLSIVLFIALLYPLFLSLALPIYGVGLLLKDIVHFYFTIYMPGFADDLLNPTFSLHGIAFSTDESERVKAAVMRFQYRTNHSNFMMAFSEGKRKEYFDQLIEVTNEEIIPASRKLEALIAHQWLPENYNDDEVKRFNAAFGIARSLDRSLVQEVALTEMALVRAVLYLRRLMLRYIKTLLMFLWTTGIAFLMLPFLQNPNYPTFVMLAIGYLIWSVLVMRLIRMPIAWIYRHRKGEMNRDHIDAQLRMMERQVAPYCQAAIVVSVIGLILALAALMQ